MNEPLRIAAAISLTETFTEIGALFAQAEATTVPKFTFGASGILLTQILAGGDIDIFAPASPDELMALQKRELLHPKTSIPLVYATNRIVVIVPVNSRISGLNALTDESVKRIALGNPAYVPAGRYAKMFLEKRRLWPAVSRKTVFCASVRQVLTYVQTGSVAAGIVYATDAKKAGRVVRVLFTALPGRDHSPVAYAVGILKRTTSPQQAEAFVRFLRQPAARVVFDKYGFLPAPTG